MGIEIEGYVSHHLTPVSGTHEGFWYITYDGSIEPPYGYSGREFISQPLMPQWLKKEIKKLYSKHTILSNRSCGIHIHVSRKWLSEKKAQAIYKFLSENKEHCALWFGREPNGYCDYERYGTTRYNAINNNNKATIEFRMFRSGNAEWATYCVDCVEYMINNAYRLNVDAFNAFRDCYDL